MKLHRIVVAAVLGLAALAARADAVDLLKQFVRDVNAGRADFTQTVTSPDGAKKKTSSGSFEFARPNRFRFIYKKPFEQLIVADGQKVWIYDTDLNQASSRKFSQALGATPAALLAGGNLEKDFELSALPDRDGLSWAQALPRIKEGGFNAVKVGFRGKQLAAVEILDGFGQRSLLQFGGFETDVSFAPQHFKFVPPAGADVIEQ
ncbi:outer membrane lipoprotein chaperone LolA [Piscinibacter sakaiensis]|uniref:outer membrane lipoprotein chaperone LolA n=1 Tax=Piscinibacter sakaiensis TaxID=1547922 RepID=UPI003AAD06C6